MSLSRAVIAEGSESRSLSRLAALGLADGGLDASPGRILDSLRGVSALWPLMICARLCSLLLFAKLDSLTHNAPALIAAGATLCIDLAIWRLPALPAAKRVKPHVAMWTYLPCILLSAALFGFVLDQISPTEQSGMGTAIPFEMGCAFLALCIFGNQRVLSLSYALGIGLAWTAGIAEGLPIIDFGVLAAFLAAASIIILRQARIERAHLSAQQKSEQRGRRAERLLVEHERSGRGWFWETDRQGAITYISETLAQSLGMKAEDLLGRAITDLIMPGDRQHGDGERTLGFHLSARTAFSEIAVRVALSEAERWWAISGQPILSDYGQFRGFRGSGTDLTEMRRSQAEVVRLAQYDSLTGLANRVQMMRTLEQAVVGSKGNQPGDCALFLIDLDRFKSVNDTLGHPAGDALLRIVSQRLQRVIGDRGMVGRLGGDEFKIVLPGRTDRQALGTLAGHVIESLSLPYPIENTQVVIGASIGIAVCPDDGVTADALIRNADLALYAAKGDGRGVYRFYSQEMHADAQDRRQLEEDLRSALAHDGLTLYYQPVVSSATEEVTGYEALLRWTHPTRGSISPTAFIPIAEEAGLIQQIGEWVLRTACSDAATWPNDIRVAVNVSPIQFANPALPSIVVSALASAGLSAGRLELEITESVFLNDDADTDAMFARLKNVGVRLALDDFGTGYSSLGYLKKAPFDKIKIDQSFVRGAAIQGNRNSAIIKSIVSLAEALGMDTTAEGAETHDELDLIRMLGCSHVQGYIYGKPMPADEVRERLMQDGPQAKADGFRSSRAPRKSMLRSIAITHDDHRYAARIRNLSGKGALIEGLWNVPAGTSFRVELAEGYVLEGVARWSIEDRMGVEFPAGIDFNKLKVASAPRALAS